MHLHPAKAVAWIKVVFEMETWGCKEQCILWGLYPLMSTIVTVMMLVLTHLPDGATFNDSVAKLLLMLMLMSV